MRSVADDEIGAGVNHQARKLNHVTAHFSVIILFCKRQPGYITAFGTSMKGDNNDVVAGGETAYSPSCYFIVEKQIGISGYGEAENREIKSANACQCEIAFSTGVFDSDRFQVFHAFASAILAEITSVVVGEIHYVETGSSEIFCVAGR